MSPDKIRDAARTREKILNTAERLFAEKGYARTTIDRISQVSNTSGALIMFHFKSKKELYSAVKARIVQRYMSDDRYTPPADHSLEAQFTYIINNIFEFYQNNPRMLRLANWSVLEGDSSPWPGEDELHHIFLEIIAKLQSSGAIRSDLTPMHILIMLSGSIHIWWEYHQHFSSHLSTPSGSTAESTINDRYRHDLLQIVLQGIKSDIK